MISVGDEGFFKNTTFTNNWIYDGTTGDFDTYISKTHISFGTYHLYPDSWQQQYSWGSTYAQEHVDSSRKANKPVIMEVIISRIDEFILFIII